MYSCTHYLFFKFTLFWILRCIGALSSSLMPTNFTWAIIQQLQLVDCRICDRSTCLQFCVTSWVFLIPQFSIELNGVEWLASGAHTRASLGWLRSIKLHNYCTLFLSVSSEIRHLSIVWIASLSLAIFLSLFLVTRLLAVRWQCQYCVFTATGSNVPDSLLVLLMIRCIK
jgi:hypothetical protein